MSAIAYYNEIDPYCCAWLQNLMDAGHIPAGFVDSRPIQEVEPEDLTGYDQCHFFAGLGGWAYALKLAGWPEDRQVWTRSCPCQPFSVIGQQKGFDDDRHLWPEWKRLIDQSKPSVIFGEQVAKAAVWLDLVFADLEACNYACGAADIPAASIGARHERSRLWFVAHSNEKGWENVKRQPTTKEKADVRASSGVVHRQAIEHLRGAFEPAVDWVVDGLSGEGNAVSAYGNAIVPQVAAEFIGAYLDICG